MSGNVRKMTIDEIIDNLKYNPEIDMCINDIMPDLVEMLEELKEYKKLEEKLCVMFAGDCNLSDVVENLERQITEPNKDHPVNARILTYEDAEKWNEYLELEEQGRLLKLPCKIGDTLWWVSDEDEEGNERLCVMRCEQPISVIGIDCDEDIIVIAGDPETNTIDKLGSRWACLTKEEAEAKLKEMEKIPE